MQTLASRSVRAQPFTSSRPMVARVSTGALARPHIRRSQAVITRVAEEEVDLAAYVDDVPVSTGGQIAEGSDMVKLRIRMRSYEINLLEQCVNQIRTVADATGAVFKGPVMLPTKKKVYCVLRSPHVNKDAREHFEIRTHHRLVDLKNLSAETVAAMMEWVPPSGVDVECSIA